MGEVAVHLDHQARAAVQRAAEAVAVGRPDPLLARAAQHADARVLAADRLGEVGGAVGGGVVDDEHPAVGARPVELGQHGARPGRRRSRPRRRSGPRPRPGPGAGALTPAGARRPRR